MFQNVWNRRLREAVGVRWAESSYFVNNLLEPEVEQIENSMLM